MIGELRGQDKGEQAFVGRTAGNDGIGKGGTFHPEIWDRLGGVFGADVLFDEELFRRAGQLSADFLADPDHWQSRFRAHLFRSGQIQQDLLHREVVGKGYGVTAAVLGRLLPLVGDLFLLRFGLEILVGNAQLRQQRLGDQISDNTLALYAEDLFFQPGQLLLQDEVLPFERGNPLVLLVKEFVDRRGVGEALSNAGHGEFYSTKPAFSPAISGCYHK